MGAKKSPPAAAAKKKIHTSTEPNKGGRPELPFGEKEWKQALTLSSFDMTQEQIAQVLDMSLATFKRKVETVPDGFELLRGAKAKMLSQLKQSAYKQALGYPTKVMTANGEVEVEMRPPNARMTQFLLNVWGGMVETKALEVANSGGAFEVKVTDYRGKADK